MNRFAGQVALVTGAGRGIGRATAERFAAEGAAVALLDANEAELQATAAQMSEGGFRVLAVPADVSDPQQAEAAVGRTVSEWGRIDILINNAGIAWEEPFLDISADHWNRIVNVNLNGMFYMAQHVARHMARFGGGCILNMASTNGLAGEEKYAHYNASKGGVVLLTKTMALELGRLHIRVNAVCPGYIRTPMSEAIDSLEFVEQYIRTKIPIGRAGKPQDVAGVFAFLASDDAAFITGECIVVDGGQLAG